MSTIIDNVVLDESNEEFFLASELVKYGHPLIFLTGKAGTGKTTFLKYLKNTSNKKNIILAYTGVAAMNAGGQTINSFFKVPFGPFIPNDKRLRKKYLDGDTDRSTIYDHFAYNREKIEIINSIELLVIDEVSMVRCDLLDVVDRLLRVFRKRENEPFGGVQVILIGDPFQLPPIDKEWRILEPFYKSTFFFNSKVVEENTPVYIELKKIYRQNEQEFIDLLNRVRVNQVNEEELALLNSKFNPNFLPEQDSNYITLATHNNIVEATNRLKLEELEGEIKYFKAEISDVFPENIMPTDKILQLKEGAQIMFIKNDLTRGVYNGKLAKISKIEDNKITAEYESNNELIKLVVVKQVWNNIRYSWNEKDKKIEEEVIGTFSQYPIKLAWAITVHKSQGLSFDKVIADLGGAFASGQVYVALSRCTTFNGLVLKSRIDNNAIITDPKVLDFAKNETPSTLIVKELNSGKADFYYKQTRNNIIDLKYSDAFDNFIKALKYRNDIETSLFKRYFVTTLSKLGSYKLKLLRSELKFKELFHENIHYSNEIENLKIELDEKRIKIDEQNNTIKLLLNNVNDMEKRLEILTKENQTLLDKNLISDNLILKLEKKLEKKKDKITKQNKISIEKDFEIKRLRNLKWYQKLLNKE